MPVTDRPDPAVYMHQVASSGQGRAYKRSLLAAMDLRAGHHVLEVGCGPGADLPAFAAAVGPTGRVSAVDHSPAMVTAAREHATDLPATSAPVEVALGDAHALDLASASIDRAHADRVLQHVGDPAAVLAELARVARPGAVVGLAEPDWATLAIAAEDLQASQAFTDHTVTAVVRNARIGRQLARLGAGAGFEVVAVHAFPSVFDDVEQADAVLGLTRNTTAAVAAGHLDPARSAAWLADLTRAPFTAVLTLFTVVLRAPAPHGSQAP